MWHILVSKTKYLTINKSYYVKQLPKQILSFAGIYDVWNVTYFSLTNLTCLMHDDFCSTVCLSKNVSPRLCIIAEDYTVRAISSSKEVNVLIFNIKRLTVYSLCGTSSLYPTSWYDDNWLAKRIALHTHSQDESLFPFIRIKLPCLSSYIMLN